MGIVENLGQDYIDVNIGGEVITLLPEMRGNKEITVSSKGKIIENVL